MIHSCVSSCTEPRSVRRQPPISLPQGPSGPPRRPTLRPRDRKLVAVTLLHSAFTKRHTRNFFRMCIYENCRGGGLFFPIRYKPSMTTALHLPWFPASGAAPCGDSSIFRWPRNTIHRPRPSVDSSVSLQLSAVSCRLLARVSSLQCAVARFRVLSPFECADPKVRPCNSFRMRSYEKRVGGTPNQGPIRNYLESFPLQAWWLAFQPFGQKDHRGDSSRPLQSGPRRFRLFADIAHANHPHRIPNLRRPRDMASFLAVLHQCRAGLGNHIAGEQQSNAAAIHMAARTHALHDFLSSVAALGVADVAVFQPCFVRNLSLAEVVAEPRHSLREALAAQCGIAH